MERPLPLCQVTRRAILLTTVLWSAFFSVMAQESTSKILQFSGVVVSGDSLAPVAYASVFRDRDHRGTFTDINGFFTLPALAGDTINFVCIGHKSSIYVLPAVTDQSSLTIIQVLRIDTINLPTAYILPWPSKNNFRREFLALGLPDDEYMLAQRNLDKLRNSDRMMEMGPDGSENFKRAVSDMQVQQNNRLFIQNNLLNPFAWAKFIQALQAGDLNPE